MKSIKILGIILLMIFTINLIAKEESCNWNQWKGPDQTGISEETDWDPSSLNGLLAINWTKNVGAGYSSFGIMGDYIYTIGFDKEEEKNVIYCLDVETGKEIWTYSYNATENRHLGPKATPVIDDNRVYTFSQNGFLLCNDSKTGDLIWEKKVVSEFGAVELMWQFSSSVRIEGDLAIVNANSSGLALNKKTGDLVWKSKPAKGNHATPVTYRVGNQLYAAI